MSFPYQDPSLPRAERVVDLLGRLTREEKLVMLSCRWPAIERIGFPSFTWSGEALHGLVHTGPATVFPATIGLAGTFDPKLVRAVADAISTEARAKFHDQRWARSGFLSLCFFTPNINLFRDPRWGRGQETYGEDPHLAGTMGLAFVRGLQGDDPEHLKTLACAKHYAVHSGPENIRTSFDARVSPKILRETYLPHFERLVRGGVALVMGAYNAVNGEPCCGSATLLGKILRGEWGFDGLVVSDAGAIGAFHRGKGKQPERPLDLSKDSQWALFLQEMTRKEGHGVTRDAAESAALALREGCDMSLGPDMGLENSGEALRRGLIAEADIDRAVGRALHVAVRLGVFDPPARSPHHRSDSSVVQSPKHLRLAREAAIKSAVLLKNNGVLPLRPEHRVIAVSGPTAGDVEVLLGNFYRGISGALVTIVEGLAAGAPSGSAVTYLRGSELVHPNLFTSTWHQGLVEWADVAVAVVGNSPLMEGECGECIGTELGGDRDRVTLPAVQIEYLRAMRAHCDSLKKPLVVLVTGGSPIVMPEVHEMADALLFVGYPGEQGGHAVADLVFGKSNPSGRLPFTVPASPGQIPDVTDYSMRGRTYRFLDTAPLYPFGFGLSYTRFAYGPPALSAAKTKLGRGLAVGVELTNAGERVGEEVVQLYLGNATDLALGGPRWNLKAFQRVKLAPGETKTVKFKVTPEMLRHVNEAGDWVAAPGEFTAHIGPCSPGGRGEELGAPAPAVARFSVV
jgi:beta-glucosidase